MMPLRTCLFGACLFACLSGLAAVPPRADDALNLPDIGDSAGAAYNPEYARRLGSAFLRQARISYRVVSDPELEHYLNALGQRIVEVSDEPDRRFSFLTVFDDRINAFAGPGGVIGINTGVILQSRDESELAGVVAHEIAHVTQRHIARAIERSSRYRIPMAAAMLGALLLGVTGGADMAAGAFKTVQGLGVQGRLNFSRANEEEADSVGMRFLADAGFDPGGMPRFFKRLLSANVHRHGMVPEFLRTHPLTTSRIADSDARAAQYAAEKPRNSREFELMKAKVEVFSESDRRDAVKIYESRLSNPERQELGAEALLYGYATALILNGRFKEAQAQVQKLVDDYPNTLHHLLLAGNMAVAVKNYSHAMEVFAYANERHPGNRAVLFDWARALLAAGDPQQARQLLRDYRQRHPSYRDDTLFYELLAQAEGQSGEQVESVKARAELFYLRGQTEAAIEQLAFIGRSVPKLSQYQEASIKSRREGWEEELALEKELKIRK